MESGSSKFLFAGIPKPRVGLDVSFHFDFIAHCSNHCQEFFDTYRYNRYNETRWSCGGILITPRVVLTAAHCQGKTPPTKIQVTKGLEKKGHIEYYTFSLASPLDFFVQNVRLGEWRVAGQAQGVELPDVG